MTDSEQFAPLSIKEGLARRKNSIAIALVLVFLVILFYAVTLVQLQGNMAKRKEMKPAQEVTVEKTVAPSSDQSGSGKSAAKSVNENSASGEKRAE